jgi:hypothetical protein
MTFGHNIVEGLDLSGQIQFFLKMKVFQKRRSELKNIKAIIEVRPCLE